MEEKKPSTAEILEKTNPLDIFENEVFKEKFITTQMNTCGKTRQDAEAFQSRTSIYFRQAMASEPKLKECTKMSILSCYFDVALEDIDLTPGMKSEAYLSTRSTNVGTKEKPQWVNLMKVAITAWGELAKYIKMGVIKRVANPIVVYENDKFSMQLDDNCDMSVKYEMAFPRKDNAKIVACFVKIFLPDGGTDFKMIDQLEIDRLAGYSKKNNRATSKENDLYTSNNGQIDPGFLMTKTIKHALKGYGKVAFRGSTIEREDEATLDERHLFPEQQQQQQPENTPTETATTAETPNTPSGPEDLEKQLMNSDGF